ncbi:MAG: hypothetical protein H6942_15350 [Candidatus Accumulibacter sp.]|uniref:hypothetical protein n=1 Tax=Accumulibacter sp. TaxID=2053492 RepID=UPI001D667034|nr:hypothetical protein [Accumulibacter sp.]MCB1941126.1 hypothetical protein [Accumulibacter sp.]MCP5249888.1 hypothetical protein [Accumulibacter sp.]
MSSKNNTAKDSEVLPDPEAAKPAQSVSVTVRLQPVEHSHQPIFSNFTTVQTGTGVVFVDFGFLEPQTMAHLARLGQPGVKIPEAIEGRLACRMALGLDTVANLANQLNHLLRSAAASQAQPAQPAAAEGQGVEGAAEPIH